MTNPQEFDRTELKTISWWSSRHWKTSVRDGAIKRSRRLVLIDLFILTIFAGVLIPWILPTLSTHTLGNYSAKFNKRKIDGIHIYTVSLVLSDNASENQEINQLGFAVMDESDRIIYESNDILPGRGEKREFIYHDEENQAESIKVFTVSNSITLRVDTSGAVR